jgi:hypothetical protein
MSKAVQAFSSKATEYFACLNTKATFITIHKYENNFGEIATHSLCWNVNYLSAVHKAWHIMESFKPNLKFCEGKPYSIIDLKYAYQEWMDSLADTIVLGPGNNPRATSAHVYSDVATSSGKHVPGVKIHHDEGVIHLTNVFRLSKVVHRPGRYPNTVSARKTLAKRDLRRMTPLKKWGQFVLSVGRFERVSINKITLVEQDFINSWNQ